MDFIIGNKVITSSINSILYMIRSQLTNGKLKDIQRQNGQNIRVSCPNHKHKEGLERHASCNIFADRNDKETEYGKAHCFSCGYTASLDEFVNECFDETGDFGKQWLLENCETSFISTIDYLPSIDLNHHVIPTEYMDESCLNRYAYYHEYMWERKLSKEIVDLFEVGYDPKRDTLVFPVRNEYGKLVFLTRRSVKSHLFMIPQGVKKPVYLLYYILQNHINSIAVCESQINCLYMWSIGIPSVCLFGTGNDYQYQLLKKSGIRVFNLFFDGDSAGEKGAYRFRKAMPKDVIINTYQLPAGKDVNDLTKEEVYNLKCF